MVDYVATLMGNESKALTTRGERGLGEQSLHGSQKDSRGAQNQQQDVVRVRKGAKLVDKGQAHE